MLLISRSFLSLLEVKLPYDPSCVSVGRSVGRSVCHYFLKGQEFTMFVFFSRSLLLSMTLTMTSLTELSLIWKTWTQPRYDKLEALMFFF